MDIYVPDSNKVVHETSVDFVRRTLPNPVHVVQYDTEMPVVAVSLFRNGQTYTVIDGSTINIRFGKPDSTFVIKEVLGKNAAGNIVYFDVDPQMTIFHGTFHPIIEVIIDEQVAGSSALNLEIDRNPVQDSYIESTPEYHKLDEALVKADEVNEHADEVIATLDGFDPIVADNVATTLKLNDKAAYLRRALLAGVGNRCKENLNGGTVVWNQKVNIANFPASDEDFINGIKFVNNGAGSVTASVAEGGATAKRGYIVLKDDYVRLISSHKYIQLGCPSGGSASTYYVGISSNSQFGPDFGNGGILTNYNSGYNFGIRIMSGCPAGTYKFWPMQIDLTALLASATEADKIYALEQATPGAGVAWFRKRWPKPYYAYDAGTLKSVMPTAKKYTGVQLWDEEWEGGGLSSTGEKTPNASAIRSKNYIPVLPSTTYYLQAPKNIKCHMYDANKVWIAGLDSGHEVTRTTAANCHYIRFYTSDTSYGTTYNHDICISFSNPRTNGLYFPYISRRYPITASALRGIFTLDANLEMIGSGDVREPGGRTTRKYGIVDLGTLTWSKTGIYFTAALSGIKKPSSAAVKFVGICSKYEIGTGSSIISGTFTGIGCSALSETIFVYDPVYESSTAAQFGTAMSGVYLVYELATPTTETLDAFASPQTAFPGGLEEYEDDREAPVPVAHDSDYQLNLREKIEQLYGIPDLPDTNGDYYLKGTKSASGKSYSWVTTIS